MTICYDVIYMNNSFEKHTDRETIDIEHIVETLRDILPNMAKSLVASTHDIADPLEQGFITNPDSPAEHSPRWHQHGILTHSEMFRAFIIDKAPAIMKEWGISNKVDAVLSEEVEGVSKSDLLQIASLVHDLGKFTARTFELKEDGTYDARFVGHEAHSGTIIRTEFKDTLIQLNLKESHIEYIAECAEHHFDLGKARQVAIDTVGYTLAFAKSDSFKEVARDIIASCPERALEIGLMFLADSFSKTEVAAVADTDDQIESQRKQLEHEVKDKNLNTRLINQAMQQPVNLEIGKQYLQEWARQQAA
jgi:HD domain-containing protein